jgi:hypothetical protein
MPPYTFIPDLNEISSSSCTSLSVEAACTTSRLSPNPKRSIVFSPFVTMYNVLHINDYLDEEIACAWYNAEELKTIKKTDVIETLSMMNDGVHIPEETPWYCSRGLESFTREGSTRKRANRANARNAVLDEQDLQRGKNVGDPEARIANAYSEQLSRHCQDAAVMKAIQQDQDISQHAASTASFNKLKGGRASFLFAGSSTRIVVPRAAARLGGCRKISSKAA